MAQVLGSHHHSQADTGTSSQPWTRGAGSLCHPPRPLMPHSSGDIDSAPQHSGPTSREQSPPCNLIDSHFVQPQTHLCTQPQPHSLLKSGLEAILSISRWHTRHPGTHPAPTKQCFGSARTPSSQQQRYSEQIIPGLGCAGSHHPPFIYQFISGYLPWWTVHALRIKNNDRLIVLTCRDHPTSRPHVPLIPTRHLTVFWC